MPADPDSPATFDSAIRGDKRAAESLLVEYLPKLRAFIRARTSDELRRLESQSDIVQSVCRDLLARSPQLEFRGEVQFRGWLFRAALNKIREKHRHYHRAKRDVDRHAKQPSPSHHLDALHEVYASVCSPSEDLMAQEGVRRIEAALDRLSPHEREVISLARFAALPHAEVARQMDKSVTAVRNALGRALLKFSRELERT